MRRLLERAIHTKFHQLADRHNLDVDLVSEIISNWVDFEESLIVPVQKVRGKTGYKSIIQVNVPIRFYWDEDGFDGIEVCPLGKNCTPYRHRLLGKIFGTMLRLVQSGESPESKVPRVFEDAFEEGK